MSCIYLSHPYTRTTPTFSNKGRVELNKVKQISKGNTTNETELIISNHSGTHIDSPYHFDEAGKTILDFPASFWNFKSIALLELNGVPENTLINMETIQHCRSYITDATDMILFKTNYEKFREDLSENSPYIFQGPGIHPELCDFIRQKTNVKIIGFDFISLTSLAHREAGRLAHRILLSQNTPEGVAYSREPVLVIEDMKLSDLTFQPKNVLVAPLLFEASDGGPVTVFAYK